jgi:hypothetical protein
MNRMRCIIFIFIVAFSATAQSSADKPSEQQDTSAAKKVDPKLHADAVKLVEASGARERVKGSLKQTVEEGKKKIVEKCSTCDSAFADEWGKRMLERLKVDDFLDVYVQVYEKYFTDDEINELISLQRTNENSQTPEPSAALKAKLASVMPSVMGDAVGGCAKIGAKLGGEIGAEIEKEHPEYLKAKAQANKP